MLPKHFLETLITDAVIGEADPMEGEMPPPNTIRRRHRIKLAKMLKGETLSELIPEPPRPGESIHAVSNGKYDFATWIPQIVDWLGTADCLYCSTWTLSRPNADDVFAVHDEGKIAKGQLHFLTGLYFKRRDPTTYIYLLEGLLARGGRYKAFENHCKVLLLANAKTKTYITVEGSANLNANPRYEQYVIVNDKKLFEFHREWMEEAFASKTTNYRSTTTTKEPGFLGYSLRRAGLRVAVVSKYHRDKDHLIAAKLNPPFETEKLANWAEAMARLVMNWLPSLPPDAIFVPPPQGASWPQPYFAAALCQAVAEQVNRPWSLALERTDENQFSYSGPAASLVVVIDDIIMSGGTMRKAIAAIKDRGIAHYGFAYYGA